MNTARSRHRRSREPERASAARLVAADPEIRFRVTPVVFYGRTAHAARTRESAAERHRQLALCRAVTAASGGQVTTVYFDENCGADHPWSRRPQGRALLAALSGPAPAQTLVTADAWCLLPRRTPAEGPGILQQLAQRHVRLVLADTGATVLTGQEYELLGRLMSGIAGGAQAIGLAALASRQLPSAARHASQPGSGEPG